MENKRKHFFGESRKKTAVLLTLNLLIWHSFHPAGILWSSHDIYVQNLYFTPCLRWFRVTLQFPTPVSRYRATEHRACDKGRSTGSTDHLKVYIIHTNVCVWVAQLCPTLCDPMDCSHPGSSIHCPWNLRILEWVTNPFSRRSSRPNDWTQVSCIDAVELWCGKTLLRVPWAARRSNQSILKEISPGCSLEGLMLKLKRQYFGYLMQRVDSLEKTLMLGGIGGRRGKG